MGNESVSYAQIYKVKLPYSYSPDHSKALPTLDEKRPILPTRRLPSTSSSCAQLPKARDEDRAGGLAASTCKAAPIFTWGQRSYPTLPAMSMMMSRMMRYFVYFCSFALSSSVTDPFNDAIQYGHSLQRLDQCFCEVRRTYKTCT